MTDKELMVNDFVLWDGKVAQVETVWRNSHAVKLIINEQTYRDAFLTDVNPIPITPEILEKNGFTKESFPLISCARFKYVHELQHALRLCKIDKEIKLESKNAHRKTARTG